VRQSCVTGSCTGTTTLATYATSSSPPPPGGVVPTSSPPPPPLAQSSPPPPMVQSSPPPPVLFQSPPPLPFQNAPPPPPPTVYGALGPLVACSSATHHNSGPAFVDSNAVTPWSALQAGTVLYTSTGISLSKSGGLLFTASPGGPSGATLLVRIARDPGVGNQVVLVYGGVAVVTTSAGLVRLVQV
jgi:hypothetical protein